MARTPTLTVETLAALGADKLALLAFNEAETNPAFRKLLNAALTARGGAGAVAKLIDRRLSALDRARAMVAWEKEREFAKELGATVETILGELAPLDPAAGFERLLRFVVSVRPTHFVSYSVPGAAVVGERLAWSAITRSIIFGSHC
jgi:hypothetical protein